MYYNSSMSTRVLGMEMKLISFEERDSLEKKQSDGDQRFNINVVMYNTFLIRGIVLTWSWIVLFQELAVTRHYERVAIWFARRYAPFEQTVSTMKGPSHLGWNLRLVLCVMTIGRLTVKTKSPFWKTLSLTFCWRPSRFELDTTQCAVELVVASCPMLLTLGDVNDHYLLLLSWLPGQCGVMKFVSWLPGMTTSHT